MLRDKTSSALIRASRWEAIFAMALAVVLFYSALNGARTGTDP